ncbi:MAG: signal recognition particle-docking protein FtsY [Synergistaceae bacterium]|nr:signal recognition particle-docking protein FtsY [Synergistaceae bacterium]MBQ3625998.1 signal recognition particle-docking protein FtsY [Synergistaceae bacterium]MBQ4418281.1 signal recognition particle-docking protein FtsY [Synergistaceae bacterium]MBQ6739428.1 signal recognition particle-docking protein FtsY [Synergistaceae bacterium]MBQ6908722.1 signal recognition particle-docking protein FtsY [Synergistaceae bacterium]
MAFFNFSLKSIKDGLNNIKEKWGISKLFAGKNKIDESFWTELEEKLILGDVGVDYSEEIIDYLRAESKKIKDIDTEKLREIFVDKLSAELEAVPGMGEEFDINNNKPYVLLMIGVNGSGKTTSAGKLAWQYKNAGKNVILAAGDTFRAAAVEQIKIWGERTGVRVIAQEQGSDAASVAFDAWRAANNSNADVLIVDTAGRLHDKHNLMEELKKVYRVLVREAGAERVHSVLVLDAVSGQNSVAQALTFNEAVPINSIILTKYDNSAKGGVILSIAKKLKVPVRYIGLGEGENDLSNFDIRAFVKAIIED